jgi:hypothetical protein
MGLPEASTPESQFLRAEMSGERSQRRWVKMDG